MPKSKGGLSSVRQFFEFVDPVPNIFTIGALSYLSGLAIDGRGYSRVRAGVTNGPGSAGTLQILQSHFLAGPFIIVASAATVVDPLTGFDVVDLDVPVTRRFVTVRFVAVGAPGLTADFALLAYLLPKD